MRSRVLKSKVKRQFNGLGNNGISRVTKNALDKKEIDTFKKEKVPLTKEQKVLILYSVVVSILVIAGYFYI